MLRCMLGSVKGEKSENPKREGEIGKWKKGGIKNNNIDYLNLIKLIKLGVIIVNLPF